MKLLRTCLVAALAAPLSGVVALAAGGEFKTERATVRVSTLARGLEYPWSLAFLPDGRLLVTERPGRMRVIGSDGAVGPALGNVPGVVAQGQGGLLDVALDRRFAANRTIYFSYAEAGDGGAATAVARARLGPAALEDVQVIFRQAPKVRGGLHFGSRIVQGADGNLLVGLGERGQRELAQDLGTHFGKVVRIRPEGGAVADNPYVGRAGALPEIWTVGHRNIQGAAINPATGQLWTVEHGARGGDEINRPERGRNYGWPVITYGRDYSGLPIGEGSARPGMEQPLHYWDPSIAPSGMAFYGADAIPGWKGSLLIGSLKFGLLVRLELDGDRVRREERLLQGLRERIRDVRVGADGAVYLLTDNADGRVLKVEAVR
ncbi:MAG: PQQ-dependent sugar dehydrogenase [Burkholderiales bacterium]|nr:PQQ-dependent sugar dehydrogenase [Burkholderiales bacterium]